MLIAIRSMASEGKVGVKRELYKTELCRHYAIGKRCPYRTKCQFAHGSDEIVDIARHPKYKTEPCKSYHSKGFCTYGPRCHFIHDYADDSSRSSFTRSSNGEVRTRTGIQDETQGNEVDQRKSNRRSERVAATEVTRRVSALPADGGELEAFRGVSEEDWFHRCQGTRKTWRQKKQQDPQERSSDVHSQNADYLIQKLSEQSEDYFSVDDRWVNDESEEELTKKSHPCPLFSVNESVDDEFESSSFYRNSFYRFDFPETHQTETAIAARPKDSTNLQKTTAKYPNAIISSNNESYSESPDLFNVQTSHQYVSPNFGRKLWTQGQLEYAVIDLNDSGDRNVKDFCPSLPAVTANVSRHFLSSFQLSSVSRELVHDKRDINCEVFSTDLRRIFEDLSKEQLFALQSFLLMDILNQKLQQSTYG